MAKKSNLVPLQRGGILILTSGKPLQIGIPPETIKDTMQLPCGVPDIFIVPQSTFFISGGISQAELEFPIYYNFFFKQRKTHIICSQEQSRRLSIVLQEALFGPDNLDYANEYPQRHDTFGYPDLQAEMSVFRTLPIDGVLRQFTMTDVVEFHHLELQGEVSLAHLKITVDGNYNFTVIEKGRQIARIDRKRPIMSLKKAALNRHINFKPPLFGITTLGTGHGFDPNAITSGMIIWINRRGIIVDPPVNAANNLLDLGVSPKLIDSVILTHCHADHDSGTLQKIMQEGKVRLYSTPTIFNSFIRKSSALTSIEASKLQRLINFRPIIIGETININGGDFVFQYSLHSIPTIRIEADYLGRGMVYSSDTMGDPAFINDLQARGVISPQRKDVLLNFPWHKDVIVHEAGVPPIHTPIQFLLSLDEEIRERLFLVHVSPESVPGNSLIKIAPAGLDNTISLDVAPPYFDEAMEALNLFLNIDVFKNLGTARARQFLGIIEREHYAAGRYIIREGEDSSSFYLIVSGVVDVIKDNNILTTYSISDYFGEKALFAEGPRTASVQAITETVLFRIRKSKMLQLIQATDAERILSRLATRQNQALRVIFNQNEIFRQLTPTQQTQLFEIVEEPAPEPTSPDEVISTEDNVMNFCYFIKSGRIDVFHKNIFQESLTAGQLFGISSTLLSRHFISYYTFITGTQSELIPMAADRFKTFADNNPGIYIQLHYYPY